VARRHGRLQGDHPPAPGRNAYSRHRRTPSRTLQRKEAPDPLTKKQIKAVEKTGGGSQKADFPTSLQIPHTTRDAHFPTASTTTGKLINPDTSFDTKSEHFYLLTTRKGRRSLCAMSARKLERAKSHVTAFPMREGPSESACRSGFQTTFGGCGQKPWS
jgi:hypothetical protein